MCVCVCLYMLMYFVCVHCLHLVSTMCVVCGRHVLFNPYVIYNCVCVLVVLCICRAYVWRDLYINVCGNVYVCYMHFTMICACVIVS